ncbi:hypothetical protein NCLIV_015720 [Neospora caninum Liverpool]|uniref:SAG-related sequence SRS22I n=1 Tax=Neospora caninum (strain Liverpool) TaxID=572307 RepID=F0VDI7_NEOCL|nr:hypothetical protein NCLIV_015720 [Neospora caninum Liverpool]CBZ51780.1 hypothetical protein NCLIV_015720 [Neospora caninum Liverpool]CEL65737.1 TPA: SAG-related sequence SRS22I [Neospora caninum Liverpool]|eukprot:XP_003881813.1 hypothetical protein NCLIV_015720 [Neospora caninum Liverpool]
MKFSLVTLGALALSAQQASALRGKSTQAAFARQGDNIPTCEKDPLSFNFTEPGQSFVFQCKEVTHKSLKPAYDPKAPQMYAEHESLATLSDILPGATFVNVTALNPAKSRASGDTKVGVFNFTIPVLPPEEHDLHVICSSAAPAGTPGAAARLEEEEQKCTVNFHVMSSAVRPVMAAGAVTAALASLLQFA